MINGILVVNKPSDYTSRDVVNEVSKVLKTKKIGHTGTLDPLATGVLVLTIKEATKLTELITSYEKEYIVSAVLGLSTDTLDVTGKVLNEENTFINEKQITDVLNSFIGSYEQEVPIYSAVKINGKKLYEYARNNEEVVLPKRLVTIYNIELLEFNQNEQTFNFKVSVSKGTYIRSLIRDIASKLNTYGCMKNLIRTKQGEYSITNSYTLEQIKNNEFNILSIEEILNEYEFIIADEALSFKVSNGQFIKNIYNKETVIFKTEGLIAIYKEKDGLLKPYKMLFE